VGLGRGRRRKVKPFGVRLQKGGHVGRNNSNQKEEKRVAQS